uniref:WRKY19-like zinc finger domain-containing protein n=1 Tax=Globisporangium ultimum (strain ATCC 200006 / CBS 805.95 / DAOM BR144) TaxID=431595 RepID=K3WBH5_GLOUD
MNCVDTSLFSAQQLHNWEQMKLRIKLAAEQNAPLAADVVHDFIAKNALPKTDDKSQQQQNMSVDFRQPLHREASIQDVLACLLEQQAPTSRMMQSSGGSFLLNSEVKNRQQLDESSKPSLKSLLSSSDFSMTEKKESLRHLLSFIDNSFASTTEPMTQVYKDCEEGTLQRLSSLQLMRQFMPVSATTQSMGGRTTSFEIIQAMLNATSNQAIQKPMSSQDSFRFQHLARTLESIETDVGYDNEDYGGDDVVQVDNLDNLLDYHGPSGAAQAPTAPPSTVGMSAGFVDTQALLNQSRSVYSDYGGYQQQQQQQQYGQAGGHNGVQSMYSAPPQLPSFDANGNLPQVDYSNGQAMSFQAQQQQQLGAAQNILKLEQSVTQHQALQQQLMQQQQKFQQHDPQKQFNQFQYQSALLPPPQQPGDMMMNAVSGAGYANGRPQDAVAQQQQFTAMMMQHHQQNFHNPQTAQRIPVATSQAKQQKQDTQGGQICSALGCNHPARVKGMCKLHGGGRRCKVEGCMKSAQTGHLCIAHGGGKPCNVEGCPKTAQSRGLCKQHGGGVRCKFEGCTKSCQSGGFCRGHGGGKRCEYPNCTKWAQKNGHCAKHAQEISQKATLVHP